MGLKNVIEEFFSPEAGQERRAWLSGKEEQFGNALSYALGPDLAPRVNALANVGAMISPGADVMEARQAGSDMFAPDRSALDRAGSAAAMVGAGAMMLMPGGASSVRQGVDGLVDAGMRAYDPSQVNMFAGRNAATADTEALARAEEMLEAGSARDDVLRDTGWFRGVDGKMRFEIDDSGAVMRQDVASLLNNGEVGQNLRTDLDGAMLHQELLGGVRRGQSYQAAYEDLGQGFVNTTRDTGTSGSYSARTGDIEIGAADSVEGRSVLLHEAQHGIQGREGFARGSSPERELSTIYEGRNIRKRELSAQMDRVRAEEGLHGYGASHPRLTPLSDEYNSLMEFDKSTANASARQNYHNSAGEVESRNASLRAAMSPARRIETPPWATQDVPDAEQIVDFGGNTAYSVPPPAQATNALAPTPQSPAQTVASMLREGRGAEVTDEMYAAADPTELHRLYTEGATGADMPMDTPSRMARADGMGFDTQTPLYHGSAADVTAFDAARTGTVQTSDWGDGVYLSPSKSGAAYYAGEAASRAGDEVGDALYDEYERLAREFGTRPMYEEIDLGRSSDPVVQGQLQTLRDKANEYRDHKGSFRASNGGIVYPVVAKSENPMYYQYEGITDPYLGELANANNNDAIFVHGRPDYDAGETVAGAVEEVLVPDPTNIRSKFARFDPRLAQLGNLSAGVAGAGAVGVAAQQRQPEQRRELPPLAPELAFMKDIYR